LAAAPASRWKRATDFSKFQPQANEHFQRHFSIKRNLTRLVNRAHTPATQLANDLKIAQAAKCWLVGLGCSHGVDLPRGTLHYGHGPVPFAGFEVGQVCEPVNKMALAAPSVK
jgi:hypothetical protein